MKNGDKLSPLRMLQARRPKRGDQYDTKEERVFSCLKDGEQETRFICSVLV